MRIKVKSVLFGMPAVMIGVIVAVLALWAGGLIGGGPRGGGVGDTALMSGVVEYTVFGADGQIKLHEIAHNSVTDNAKNLARNFLGTDGAEALFASSTYDNILLCQAPSTVIATLCSTMSTSTNAAETNPTEGTNADGGTGVYTVTQTWTAVSGAMVIEGFQLGNDVLPSNGVGIATVDVGFFQETGTINLADGDSITVTWTITFN